MWLLLSTGCLRFRHLLSSFYMSCLAPFDPIFQFCWRSSHFPDHPPRYLLFCVQGPWYIARVKQVLLQSRQQ
ncbi:hypothetical protein HDV64DRAFT_261096 [Trichoderma sp. TUCIM 5745]